MSQRDLANILSGPCKVILDGTDLGHTSGPVRLELVPSVRPVRADAWGGGPVDYVHLGTEIRLTARLAEWTLPTLQALFPLAAGVTGGLGWGESGGTRLAALAKPLTLHPLERPDADATRDLVFWKAVAAGATTVDFARGEDRLFETVFHILPDLAKDEGERLGTIGAD
jgi:hypothetical protein